MEHFQQWFERIAGVNQAERERVEFVRKVYGKQPFDASVLQTPACWRRSPRFRTLSNVSR